VRGTNGGRGETIPLRIVPAGGQVPENVSHPSNKETWDILHEDVTGSYRANASGKFGPEPSVVGRPQSSSSEGDGLAGEAPADEIDGLDLFPSDFTDVAISLHPRPVLLQHGGAERIVLNLPRHTHSRSLKSKIQTANPRKQRPDGQHHALASIHRRSYSACPIVSMTHALNSSGWSVMCWWQLVQSAIPFSNNVRTLR